MVDAYFNDNYPNITIFIDIYYYFYYVLIVKLTTIRVQHLIFETESIISNENNQYTDVELL